MGRINIVLDDGLEYKFREVVSKRLGFKKGNLSLAVEEAIKDWMNKNQKGRFVS